MRKSPMLVDRLGSRVVTIDFAATMGDIATLYFDDREGHPTHEALQSVLDYLAARLKQSSRGLA
jgi:hypothetical protein